ncbi:L-gulonolactone oxidase [Sanguibacter gelidistatuariae]|uniref:L-gulonolactone oxidase n=1 Tax=Sanguibacter gelidistatuariae TaxID=1814289 RepID=A0A1G6PNY7_9MICO|nr:D-arabinono-1,4-lactone oxidase [Sanguibacter gelidistatuariae]SDC81962.1 L-gulonolactone oxidase [Sanguibacter gelidistatuariae]
MTTSTPRAQAWTNWARTTTCTPARIVAPRDEEAVRAAVLAAAGRGETVRAVGAGHSFTPAAATSGVMLSLDHLTGLERLVPLPDGGSLVTVGAGIRLYALNTLLAENGLAMVNLGDIDRQSLAGALSTGTHGTGGRLTGLAALVHGVRVLTADGSVVEADAQRRPALFQAARLGLGAVGVLLAVTLRTTAAYTLTAQEEPWALDAVLDGLTGPGNLVDTNDHFEFYWFPHTRRALTKRNNRGPADTGSRRGPLPGGASGASASRWSRARRWIDDELLSNGLFTVTNEVGVVAPATIPSVNNIASRALSARTYTAPSHEVFVTPRRVRFREMEYAVPRADLPEVLGEVDRWIKSSGERVSFPVEVRFAAPDDVWLSTAYGREPAYIAVHQYIKTPHERYFAGVETILRRAEGRPHWGKLHTLGARELRELYPRFEDFQAVRTELDPAGLFANAYTRRVFGD